jgi:DNA-binding HxlR family transcriptional regulator
MGQAIVRKSRAAVPLPGAVVRGSKTGRPIMALFDLIGRRWSLRILWELRHGDALSFRDLQRVAGNISPTILSTRTREMREARLLELGPAGYALTDTGHGLLNALQSVDGWARAWSATLRPKTR